MICFIELYSLLTIHQYHKFINLGLNNYFLILLSHLFPIFFQLLFLVHIIKLSAHHFQHYAFHQLVKIKINLFQEILNHYANHIKFLHHIFKEKQILFYLSNLIHF